MNRAIEKPISPKWLRIQYEDGTVLQLKNTDKFHLGIVVAEFVNKQGLPWEVIQKQSMWTKLVKKFLFV